MLEHYFHESYQFRAKRRNIRQFKMNTSKNKLSQNRQKFVCMSNGNAIQIYKLSSESVDFYMRKQFFCNIIKVQVIPSSHHDSDFIFILDELGRYSFWRPGESQKQTSNIIRRQGTSKRFYRQQLSPEEQEQFSGSDFRYDVKDTVGFIFFTTQNKLTLLNISVKLKEGLKINNARSYEIPYTRFRFVNCLSIPTLRSEQFCVGIIQELEQRTILKVHILNPQISSILIDEESLTYKIQKINLLSFQSGENDQIIILTYDQISIYKYKQAQYVCNYRTRGNYGSVCYIQPISLSKSHTKMSQATYIHLGFEMTVFTKNRLNNYGPLKFEDKNLLEGCGISQSKYLGHLSNGEAMIAFATEFSQIFFVILYQNKWRLIRKIQSLSSIASLHQLQKKENPQSMIAVHSSLEGQVQITHLQVISPTIIQQEQTIENKIIETINVIDDGQSIIVCSEEQNTLLSWGQQDKKWVDIYQLPNHREQVLACTGIYVIMTTGIYKYQTMGESTQLTMTQLLKQQNILSAVTNKNYIGYYTSEGTYKFYEFESNSISRIRKNCIQQYIWHMLQDKNVLISASYSELGQLRVLPISKVAKKIQLQSKELVSSIGSFSTQCQGNRMVDQSEQTINSDLVVGFHNGDIEIYSLSEQRTINRFNIGSQMVEISAYRSNHQIVYTSTNQYILSRNKIITSHLNDKQSIYKNTSQKSILNSSCSQKYQYCLHQIELSDKNNKINKINKILYLNKFDKFLILFYSCSQNQEVNNTSQSNQKTLNSSSLNNLNSLNNVNNINSNEQQHQPKSKSTIIQLKSLKLNKKLSDNQLTLQLKSSISFNTIFKCQSLLIQHNHNTSKTFNSNPYHHNMSLQQNNLQENIPLIQIIYDEYIFIVLSQTIMKYNLKTKQLLKKQMHLLKSIIAIDKIYCNNGGILLTGQDLMDTYQVILFDFHDLNIKSTYSLSNSKPFSLKSLKTPPFHNRFFLRHQNYLSILQIQPTSLITHIKTINTKIIGCSMDISQKFNKIILNDSNRYLTVWDYDLEISSYDVLPVSKYFGPHLINDCCWLDGAVVTGDRGGKISILEFNLNNNNDLHKMDMSKVAQIYLGEQIYALRRVQDQSFAQDSLTEQDNKLSPQVQYLPQSKVVYYGTSSGSVGRIKTISEQQFKLLKRIELDTLKYIDTKQRFSYQQWRGRITQKDKIIDSSIIKYYLDEFRYKVKVNQQQFYEQVKKVYNKLVNGNKNQINKQMHSMQKVKV